MGISHFVLLACLSGACLLVGLGFVRLLVAVREYRVRRIDAQCRAAALVSDMAERLEAKYAERIDG